VFLMYQLTLETGGMNKCWIASCFLSYLFLAYYRT